MTAKRKDDEGPMFELEVEETGKKGKTSPRTHSSNGARSKDTDEWTKYEQQAGEAESATKMRRDTEFIDKLVRTMSAAAAEFASTEKRQELGHCLRVLSLLLTKGKYDQSAQDVCNASPLANLLINILRHGECL